MRFLIDSLTKISIENPIMSSTGVIGYRLNIDKITSSFDKFDFSAKDSTKLRRSYYDN